ncbi:MAG: hypothetical protein JXB04_03465, partial [Kiritimatiellae bacterium]|nr:hypothetical protein [Kiritimatiellia bacterium]
ATGWEHTGYVREVLEDVRQVVFLVYGDNGAGEVYLDNITIRRDDGFIIYADDPVCDVIRDHADYMRAKSNGSTPPPACTISGTTYYSGMLTGLIHIVATGSGSADSDALAGPGAYTLTDVHGPDSFTVIAYRDCNGNGTQDAWEASGAYAGNPLYLTTDVTGIDIALIDPPGDSDSDNMTDVWEGLHFGDLTQAADGDSDRDGYMNYFEFMRGTLPAAPTSIPAATIYVDVSAAPGGDGSQGQPFNTIQPALNAAVHGDLVHLAAGVYTGSANRGLLFNNQRVMLYSTAGATSCVIDCQHLDRAILESNGMPGLALVPRVVRDVTICHGQPTNGLGGVIFVGSNGAMMFQKCILENNTASLGGVAYLPGPYVYQMRIDDSIIRGNSAGQGGVVYSYYAVPYLKGCLIQSNSASLAAVLYATETGTPPLLEDCTIERNQAGAAVVLYANAGAHPTARRCQIRENVATGSGGVMGAAAGAGAGPILESCMVVGNVSGTGGGVLGGSGIMRNCTMVNNVASNGLGGIARLNSIYMGPQDYATIVNCILWDFGANAFYGVVAPSVSYSDVQGGYAGTGNIDTNPLFQSGTYRLLPGSPCIDAGTASNAPATDWEGEARWDDPSCPNTYSIVDIGADEFVDRDDDDLLDAEEFVAQGLPAGSTNEEDLELLAQAGDADGDGAPDWYELRTGTSPTNSESIFAAGGGQTEASGEEAVVTWPSAAYKTYSLERSLDLASGFAAIATNIPATPPLNTYTDQPPTEVVYYRVQVE